MNGNENAAVLTKARAFAHTAYTDALSKSTKALEYNLAVQRNEYSRRGILRSGNMLQATAQLYAKHIDEIALTALNGLLEGYDLHGVNIDEQLAANAVDECMRLKDALLIDYMKSVDEVDRGGMFTAEQFAEQVRKLSIVSRNTASVLAERYRLTQEKRENEVREIKAAKPPSPANEWHPEIEKVSRKIFNDGHYREAVLNSYIRVIEVVKQKSQIQDDGDGLMGRAFGCELGRVAKVQFNPCQTQADIDEQKGIMFLFKGVVGMRNFKAHTVQFLDDEQRAREYLGLSSLLMRLLDTAKVNP